MQEATAYISVDPEVLAGKPVIAGTRLSVEHIIGRLADGWSYDDLIDAYPGLQRAQIAACLAYARDLVERERVYPSAA